MTWDRTAGHPSWRIATSLLPKPRWTIPSRDRVTRTAAKVARTNIQIGNGTMGMTRLKTALSQAGELPPGAGCKT